MADNKLDGIKKIHFIGIGGSGMSALAYVLLKRGFSVSGSDINSCALTVKLGEYGAEVYAGHAQENVFDKDAVVVSSAIREDNVELRAARALGLPVLHRSDVLASILNNSLGVAVAGAHGKTTTSAMLACITTAAGLDPTAVIGGEVSGIGGNARNGDGKFVVAEADESDGSFLKFFPYLTVITNIENDHLDHYGSEENIYAAFTSFLQNIKSGGKAVLCIDNEKLKQLSAETDREVITYGMEGSGADYTAANIRYSAAGTSYELFFRGKFVRAIELVVPGRHNVLNSMGAFIAAVEMGAEQEVVAEALKNFGGAKRRFETKGRADGVWVVDDYAHHPTEISVTLKAARQTEPQRLICVFQPHRYTRTKLLFEEFCNCFKECDLLILTDIYGAGEDPIAGVSGDALAKSINRAKKQQVEYIASADAVAARLQEIVKSGDLVMTVGAGSVYKIGEELVKKLEKKANG